MTNNINISKNLQSLNETMRPGCVSSKAHSALKRLSYGTKPLSQPPNKRVNGPLVFFNIINQHLYLLINFFVYLNKMLNITDCYLFIIVLIYLVIH